MLRSFYSGISGLRNFQTKLDVVSNNIANVNTTGFKKSRVMFQDIISQTLQGATAPAAPMGGINPKQVGLGASISSIDTTFNTGTPQTTNVKTDMYINGNGFFIVTPDNGTTLYLTRAGNFTLDAEGNLVNSQGMKVVGDDGSSTFNLKQYTGQKVVDFSIGQDGTIELLLDDGSKQTYGTKIGVAVVANPAGLEKIGNSLYRYTRNADTEPTLNANLITYPNNPAMGSGALWTGFLEMSNVDLSEEFTEMIIAQRGFQANSRIITTSDEVLQELVNLKR